MIYEELKFPLKEYLEYNLKVINKKLNEINNVFKEMV